VCPSTEAGGIGKSVPPLTSRCDGESAFRAKGNGVIGQEKPLASKEESVPQSDTGRRGENPKVDE
jgi:hypothetical protein